MKPKLFLLLSASLFYLTALASNKNNTCRQSDSLNLVVFYYTFESGLDWDINQPMDTWEGITLDEAGCVVSIKIKEGNLKGQIAPEIGNLSSLEHLDLQEHWQISGQIPPEIGKLKKLTYLNLCENSLTGKIPPEIGNLENLLYLNLMINNLEGELPKELGNLKNLSELNLKSNNLGGCFNPNLKNLCSSGLLRFQDQGEFSNYNKNDFDASWWDFCDNNEGACNPNSICRQKDSLNLVAFYNTFERKPNWDLNMPIDTWQGITLNGNGCIIEMDLSDMCSIGSITTGLTNLSHLTRLELEDCDITGNIPAEISNLTSLTYLSLASNKLIGEIPAEIGNLENLTYLNLCENDLEGNVPGELGNLNVLQYLFLQGNKLSGCFDKLLKNICELIPFASDDDDDDGGGFSDNNFDVSWYDFCQNDKGVCNPYSPCRQIDSLNLIALYNNFESGLNWDLTKPLDTWYGIKLTGDGCVKEFFIDDESVCGSIAPEIGNLSHMTKFGLPENCITGTIPPEIGLLTKLSYLSLGQNYLTGTLPSELANLTGLTYLDLKLNTLEGEIPETYNNLMNLNTVNLSGNNLGGCFHASLDSICTIEFMILDNDAFDAEWEDFCNYASGICCENPAADIYWSGNSLLQENIYQAQNSIETSNDGSHRVIYPSSKRAVLKAGSHIMLNGNFTVQHDIDFIMAIDSCK